VTCLFTGAPAANRRAYPPRPRGFPGPVLAAFSGAPTNGRGASSRQWVRMCFFTGAPAANRRAYPPGPRGFPGPVLAAFSGAPTNGRGAPSRQWVRMCFFTGAPAANRSDPVRAGSPHRFWQHSPELQQPGEACPAAARHVPLYRRAGGANGRAHPPGPSGSPRACFGSALQSCNSEWCAFSTAIIG
jgi:hypothetical protein